MAYTVLEVEATQQVTRSITAFDQYENASALNQRFAFTLFWEERSNGVNLCKIDVGGRVHVLGLRTEKLTAVFDKHYTDQQAAQQALEFSTRELQMCQRLNIAAQVNRVPNIVIRIFEELRAQGVMDYYTVIGTHALYAYEAAAGVTFDQASTATNDVDLLWHVENRVKFVRDMKVAGLTMVKLLQRVDPSFERNEEQLESAMNATGFSVDFLRRQEPNDARDAFSITGVEGDVYPVQAVKSYIFRNSPKFEHVIIGDDGNMTRMRTVDPKTFVDFKL